MSGQQDRQTRSAVCAYLFDVNLNRSRSQKPITAAGDFDGADRRVEFAFAGYGIVAIVEFAIEPDGMPLCAQMMVHVLNVVPDYSFRNRAVPSAQRTLTGPV